MTRPRPSASTALGAVAARLLLGLTLAVSASACQDSSTGCVVNGVSHPAGTSFQNDCNTCTCSAGGQVACTTIACAVDAGAETDQGGDGPTCDFATSYDYGYIGGLRASVDRSYLTPGNQYRHTRTPLPTPDGGTQIFSCAPALPACGASDVITAYDIEVHDLSLADVQAALAQATPPLYGFDMRPVDGFVFEFKRADGRGFLVGSPCSGTTTACTAVPAGVAQLRQRLLDLDTQQLAQPECAALPGP